MEILSFLLAVIQELWEMLTDASVYVLFGLLMGGILKMFLSPAYVARHLGKGRFKPVLKAALFGIPLPLCSCGVLPAAVSLKKQGANNGATTAFLISTPESGVDSISVTYALLDPVMTIVRPLAAFITALVAGFSENIMNPRQTAASEAPDLRCQIDNCCSGENCPPDEHAAHHSLLEKMTAGVRYAKDEIWGDLAGWFFLGLLAAGVITVLVPAEQISIYLGGGLSAMLLMLVFGMPLYICATASTPIAAAMILKGVSPGAALVFLLVGPATNITSVSVVLGLLGKRATALYLLAIAVVSVGCGLLLDFVYLQLGISAKAVVGQAAELLPVEVRVAGGLILILLSVKPLAKGLSRLLFTKKEAGCTCGGNCSPASPVPFPAPYKTAADKGKRLL